MFDAHIQFYAYNNIEGDEFGVGYLGNKKDWVRRINRWNANERNENRFTLEDWDELDCKQDFRGLEIAEVEPIDGEFIVTFNDTVLKINKNHEVSFVENPKNITSVPRWVGRLKTMLREGNIQ